MISTLVHLGVPWPGEYLKGPRSGFPGEMGPSGGWLPILWRERFFRNGRSTLGRLRTYPRARNSAPLRPPTLSHPLSPPLLRCSAPFLPWTAPHPGGAGGRKRIWQWALGKNSPTKNNRMNGKCSKFCLCLLFLPITSCRSSHHLHLF